MKKKSTGPQLSPRERQVVQCVARGSTYNEIAVDLGISYETVKMHLARIRNKLQLRNRTELAVWWLQNSGGATNGSAA